MRPRGARSEVTRQRVLTVAAELFARHGFAATGIRDIATAADLSSSSLYEYMQTKDHLLVAIMRSSIEPLIDSGHVIRSQHDRPDVQLTALVERHVAFHVAHPHETLVTDTELRALGAVHRAEIVALRDSYESIWRGTLADGVETGVFEIADQHVAVRALLSLCTGITAWYRPGGRLSVTRLTALHADLAVAAVRAVPQNARL